MPNEGLGGLLQDTAEMIGGSDDLVDGITHFAKKNKTEDEKVRIDERGEDFKAAGKILKGGLKWATLALGVLVGVKFLTKD